MAKIHYEADGDVPPDRFIAALTDFSSRRPELWPNLSPACYSVHEVGAAWADVQEGTLVAGSCIWARERYDWSEPGRVTLTLVEAATFRPGTVIDYRITSRPGGGCHVSVDFQRIASSPKGRLVGAVVQLTGSRRFASDLRETLARLAAVQVAGDPS
jgi:Polyketide cyclase / dehydrase and lipid transport